MASGGAFGGARGYQPRPPEKGVFPLDHFGECENAKQSYVQCLSENAHQAEPCRDLAKKYLECRMDKQLMAPQDLKDLGFSDKSETPTGKRDDDAKKSDREKERKGFLAGMSRLELKR